jgi:hypothetical protein
MPKGKIMRPMPCKHFFKLRVGDKVFIHYCKDDNPEYERLNQIVIVESTSDNVIITEDSYEWSKDEVHDWESNRLETGRGTAKIFFP